MTNQKKDKISKVFKDKYNTEPLIVKSPGRINIIGEHTDYNEGFVLPAAIDKAIYVAISKRPDHEINLYSVDYGEEYKVLLHEIKPTNKWTTYILGVVYQLLSNRFEISGFNLVIDGDVPIGAGLSSSAAVECATVFALNEVFALGLSKMEMVKIAQKAEHTFSGVLCGLMDMFASMFGKKEHAIKFDCRSLDYEYIPLSLAEHKIVLLNTNIKHALTSSAYNERRQQCEQGVAWISEHLPQVNSLREASTEMLKKYVLPKDELIFLRCKYVVEEIERLENACKDLEQGNIEALGQKMFQTHDGLSKAYDVSCRELDFLVDTVKSNANVIGARMMGGGFGGCTINIIKENEVDTMINQCAEAYRKTLGIDLTPYTVVVEEGTCKLT